MSCLTHCLHASSYLPRCPLLPPSPPHPPCWSPTAVMKDIPHTTHAPHNTILIGLHHLTSYILGLVGFPSQCSSEELISWSHVGQLIVLPKLLWSLCAHLCHWTCHYHSKSYRLWLLVNQHCHARFGSVFLISLLPFAFLNVLHRAFMKHLCSFVLHVLS